MNDSRLSAYIKTVIGFSELAFRAVVENGGNEDTLTMEFPPVTLFLSGMVVSGNVVSPREYYKRMRKVIESNSTGENSTQVFEEAIIENNTYVEYPLNIQELQGYEIENIHLVNVIVLNSNQRINIAQAVFSLSSVQGWSMGTTA